MAKILVAALPIGSGFPSKGAVVMNSTEAASQLTRLLRANDPTLATDAIVQLPYVDGGEGTIDFLVTHTLGSFLEVEATDARGEDAVVPLGFASEDGKLAVIEMGRAAGVAKSGDAGTTFGIGELIRDALDEGAFSVLLGHDEPLAADAGLGAVAALGVKFLGADGNVIDMKQPNVELSKIATVDATGRSFELLSSRFYIAKSDASAQSAPSAQLLLELDRLSKIIERDCAIHASTKELSASAMEYGLRAFLGAEVKNGSALTLEASRIPESINRGEFETTILIADNFDQIATENVREWIASLGKNIRMIFRKSISEQEGSPITKGGSVVLSLQDAKVFQAPLTDGASTETIRRDVLMRLEKLMPNLMEQPLPSPSKKSLRAERV